MRAQEFIEQARIRSTQGDLQGAREMLLKLLRSVPRHLEGQILLGHILLRLGIESEARNHFELALAIDPINSAALRGAAEVYQRLGARDRLERTRQLMDALDASEWNLEEEGNSELQLVRAESLWASGRYAEARALLAKIDLPCARAQLILADMAIQDGDEGKGVARLHTARGLDPSLLVARELYAPRGLYVEYLQGELEIDGEGLESPPLEVRSVEPIPRPIAMAGSMRAGDSQGSATPMATVAELTIRSEDQIELIVTSRGRLLAHYGEYLPEIEERLAQLAETIRSSSAVEAAVVYVDDAKSLLPWGVSPVDPGDAGQVHVLIEALEERLSHQGLRADYLLLVGGDEIMPFFRMPNLTEDQDEIVLSDMPYAARGANYLLAERAVGRIPVPAGDPRFLIESLERTAQAHRATQKKWGTFRNFLPGKRSLGISAQIWEEAARAVFAPIGGGKALQISPPATDQEFLEQHTRLPHFAYFNLHGVRGGPYWYGHQSASGGPDDELLFPIALTPHNLAWLEVPAGVVFSEACYGAEVNGRSPQDSIALGFLGAGARAFVGSTAMAYGSLSTPLSGADLLARFFWLGLLEGHPVGEALRRAKLGLVEEMGQRQGYLDAEDQKTLLSFVLYGDPSLPGPAPSRAMRKRAHTVACPSVVCGRSNGNTPPLPREEILEQVKAYIAGLVPKPVDGLNVAALKLCRGDCGCASCPLRRSAAPAGPPEARWVFTASLREPLPVSGELPQVVRVTTDPGGSILKVAFSK